ncbi:MAG: flagellar basal body L-ring protein FlgH [Proteobacteria bacterium]|nr:flagellar basal body L-ring protein FlgH [Pseudomonadota bacterium]
MAARPSPRRAALAALVLLPLGACSAGLISNPKLPPAAQGPAYRAAQNVVPASGGAIYQPVQSVAFFEDPRGHRVGDVITIRLNEAFNASKTASTQTQKDNSTAITAPVFAGKIPLNGDTTLGAKRAFTGNGTATQQNALTGSITAVVTEVLPNGNLLISGEKALQLNQGEEYVRVQGVVRVVDVQSDNSVTSDRIADARISYNGKGVIDGANKPGWLARFFSSPLAPF